MNRGGSFNNKPANVRAANRNRNEPTNRNDNLGFRLAQSARIARAVCLLGSAGVPAGVHEPSSWFRKDVAAE